MFLCDIAFQQNTQSVRLLNYWLKCRELKSFFVREAHHKTIKLTHCKSAKQQIQKTKNKKQPVLGRMKTQP